MSAAQRAFASGVKSEVVPLCGVDMPASFVRIPGMFFFENTDGRSDFMLSELLQEGLYKMLARAPVLAGRLRATESGFLEVVVDRDDLNFPPLREAECDLHFDQAREGGFDPTLLPPCDESSDVYVVGRSIRDAKLASVAVFRLRENSGAVVIFSVAHGLVDAAGFVALTAEWARECRVLAGGGTQADAAAPPISYDRRAMQSCIPDQAEPDDSLVRHVHVPGTFLSRQLARASPEMRGRILQKVTHLMDTVSMSYHVSRKTLDRLREEVVAAAGAEKQQQRISHNDLLVAVLTILMAQCAQAPPGEKPGVLGRLLGLLPWWGSGRKTFQTSVAADIRPRVPGVAELGYCGNGMIKQTFATAHDDLLQPVTAELVGSVAARVRRATEDVTLGFVQQFAHTIERSPDCYIRPIVCGIRHPMKMMTSNHTRLGYYGCDFGSGAPAWACPPSGVFPNMIFILPAPAHMDGYNVFLSTTSDIMPRIAAHKYWTNMTTRIN